MIWKNKLLAFIVASMAGVMTVAAGNANIDKFIIVGHEEMTLDPDEILNLPGIGLIMQGERDSLILLDDPAFATIRLRESNGARSLVAIKSGVYSAEGDSICRVASDSLPHRFIGRMDNEQFTLHNATDSTFYALTADEEFSCIYEIYPETCECEPIISLDGPIQKIEGNGLLTALWIDDAVLSIGGDGKITPVFRGDNIFDFIVSPIGVMIATGEGIFWLTGPDEGAKIVNEPVKALWWDDSDVLYYLTAENDLIAVCGMLERFLELRAKS